MTRRGLRAGLGALLAGLLVAGCGIRAEDEPRVKRLDVVDRDLPIERSGGAPVVEIDSNVFLVGTAGRLRPTTRRIGVSSDTATQLASLLGLLVDGPTAAEAAEDLRSAVPSTTEVLDVAVEDGTAVVDLSTAFASIGGSEELLAVGQLVLTVTTFPGVRRMVLRLDGRSTSLPLPDGSLTEEPVALNDYAELLAPETLDTGSGGGG